MPVVDVQQAGLDEKEAGKHVDDDGREDTESTPNVETPKIDARRLVFFAEQECRNQEAAQGKEYVNAITGVDKSGSQEQGDSGAIIVEHPDAVGSDHQHDCDCPP